MGLPDTESRVMQHTKEEINECLRRQLEARVLYYAQHDDLIDDRLAELDAEWDMERTLEAHAAGVSLAGILLASKNRKWLLLPLVVAGFLMQHALQGWCPPIEIFRRIGVRTTKEINHERYALKALRGDFDGPDLSEIEDPAEKAAMVLQAVEKQ